MTIFRLSDTETLVDRLLDILGGILRIIRHYVLHDTSFYAMRACEDKIPTAFTLKKKKIGRFEGLPQFKWTVSYKLLVFGHRSLIKNIKPLFVLCF